VLLADSTQRTTGATPASGDETGRDARSASVSSAGEDQTRHFEWTPTTVLWTLATLLALIVLGAGPTIRDRWQSR